VSLAKIFGSCILPDPAPYLSGITVHTAGVKMEQISIGIKAQFVKILDVVGSCARYGVT
jgi:hypothetical protein